MSILKTAKKIGAGAMNILKGTLENMGSKATAKRYADMDKADAEKRAQYIRENFGNEEVYNNVTKPNDPMFQTDTAKIGKGIGSFVERLANARKTATAKSAGKPIIKK